MSTSMHWSPWRKPQNLVLAAAVAALLGMTWMAFDLTGRVATTSDAITALVNPDGAGADEMRLKPSRVQQLQALKRLRAQLDEDLRQLKFAIGGAMAGNILLLLFIVLGYRDPVPSGVASPARHRGHASGAAAGSARLDDLSKLLQSASDYTDACQVVQRCAAGMFAGCSGALYLVQDPGGRFEIKAGWGQSASNSSFAADDCWAIRRGEANFAADPADMVCGHLPQPLAAPSLCVPVMGQGAVLGVLLLEDHAKTGVLASMRAAAKNFAGQIGLALANMRLRETLRELSVRDPHTGLFNRRYMEESLNREIAAARRKNRPLAAAVCELNQFERFKTSFGGDAADFALREIALLINKHIRSSDIACRYGKSEIVLILPEAPVEGAVMRANQLRQAVFALDLEYFGRRLDKLSVSFGVALFPQHGKTPVELLRQAEAALAGAKVFGNNRVQVAEEISKQG